MARGGDDSDEERHDRFRSERSSASKTTTSVALTASKRYDSNSKAPDKRYDDHRSRERDRSRNWRSREQHSAVRRYESEVEYRRRRSRSVEIRGRDDRSKSPNETRRSHKERNRDKPSGDDKSDSRSSHESHCVRKKHKHSKRSRDYENTKSEIGVDTFIQKFDRRRESSVEEVVDDNVIFWDSSSSPDRERTKNHRNGEKERKKEKRKEKKKKREIGDKSRSTSPSLLTEHENKIIDVDITMVGSTRVNYTCEPKMLEPPEPQTEIIHPIVPSTVLQDALPGNRSTLPSSPAEEEKDFYGPIIPPSLHRKEDDEIDEPLPDMPLSPKLPLEKKDEDPPKKRDRVYGPTLPERTALPSVVPEDMSYGPALPPYPSNEPALSDASENEEDGSYGPQPLGMGGRTQEELEIRAALIKRQLENKDTSAPPKREKWMTELPEAKRTAFGLGPRKFKKRDGPDLSDRSSWTDTPEEKNRKLQAQSGSIDDDDDDDGQTDSRRLGIQERDREMEKRARQGKKRDKSLLEMHQKTIKKKKKKEKKEKGEPERRPFNREIDLQTNRFDEAQKRSIIKKAQLLDSRFSSGESKYL